LKGQKARTLIKQDFEEAYKKCDVIVAPISPAPAFKLKEKLDDPLQMYLSDIFTISANLAGIPAMSIPCGLSEAGLPIGLQLMGKHFDEATLLNVGHQFQQTTDHHLKHPSLRWTQGADPLNFCPASVERMTSLTSCLQVQPGRARPGAEWV